jgi:hypothetical protein
MREIPSWDQYYLDICKVVAARSKDPNTQIGCVIVGPNHEIRSTGYNSFPPQVRFWNGSNVVVEDMTLEGSNVDSGQNSTSEGVRLWDGANQKRVTIRRLTIRGVDKGMAAEHSLEQMLIYDCTMAGNNPWQQSFVETNISWNDDGVRLPGKGNAIFNNTMSGFGDTFAVADYNENVAVHFYRNDIKWTDDDAYEGDYGHRNLTFYDNRIQNSMTLASFDPVHGGPAYVFRNIAINTGRSPFKFNSENSGHFVYNNTIVRTNGFGGHAGWGWIQFNNGDQRAWAYRNNLLIYRGTGKLYGMESGGQTPIDFTNNAWYPNGQVWWSATGGSYGTMAEAYAALPATQPLFGTATKRHQNDRISESDPFVVPIVLGSDYLTQITTAYTPAVSSGTAPSGSGVAIAGITDGYSGSAPDIGAIITGRPVPLYGDRSGVVLDAVAPSTTSDLRPR